VSCYTFITRPKKSAEGYICVYFAVYLAIKNLIIENLISRLLIEYHGHVFPIIWRKKGAKDGETDPCPFCGNTHLHGKSEGHRIAHCPTGAGENLEVERKVYLVEDGYYLKEY
jgi:hypothetical protein